jgi:WD40 repeat protein
MKRTTVLLFLFVTISALFAAGPPTAPSLVLETGFHTARITRVATDAKGRWYLTSADDKSARLWDPAGRLLATYRVPNGPGDEGKLYACALSPDGALIAVGGSTGYDWDQSDCVYVFDRQSGSLVRRLVGLEEVVNHLAFSADGSLLGCALGKTGIRIYDTRTWKQVYADRDFASDSYSFVFSADGRSAASSALDGSLRLYRLQPPGLIAKVPSQGGKEPFGLCFSPDGKALACGFIDSAKVDVYAVSKNGLSLAYSPDIAGVGDGTLSCVAFSADGRSLAAGGGWWQGDKRPVRVWSNAGRGPHRDLEAGATDVIMDLRALPDGSFLVASADPVLSRLSPEGELSFSLKPRKADYRGNWDGLRLSADGRAFDYAYGQWGVRPASFDLVSRGLGGNRPDLAAPDSSSLQITDWKNENAPKLNGTALALKQYEISRSVAVAPGASSFLLGADWYLRCFDGKGGQVWRQSAPGVAWAVNVSSDGKIGVAAYGDGTIRFHRMSDGKELLAFFPHSDGRRWVLWTPSGYYDCSPGGEDLIGWQVNNGADQAADFFPASRFRATYYRPDVVSLVLDTLDEARAIALANSAAGGRQETASILDKRPPIVTITSPDSGSAVSSGEVTLHYRLRTPDDAPVTSVKALVDGRPIEGARGLAVVAAADADQSVDLSVPARDCTVSLVAENRNGSSEAASIGLVWKGAQAGQDEFVIKPKLYVLAVGVSAYEKPEYHLNYAAKDARDLAALLGKGGPLYRGVETKVLTDAEADKDDILDGLDWIEKQTTSKDIAVILFSGHGINDSNGDYYYLPVNADIDRLKRSGVPFSDIKTTVSHIAGKVLFFIDTCHSGNLMEAGRRAAGAERDIGAVINELASAENGAIVFASSTGSQYSYEDPAWGNGAFTKALLEGLGGAADYNKTGRITVNMLDLYISERVKDLTGGKQTPTTTKPPNVPDFPVAMKP